MAVDKVTKDVTSIHDLLLEAIKGANEIPPNDQDRDLHFASLQVKLSNKSMAALEFVANDLQVAPIRVAPVHALASHVTWRKADFARGLVDWVSHYIVSLLYSALSMIAEGDA